MNKPKVSVIVPVYKAESYLHKCVDSLLAQTMTDFEILLIDDGSPDKSGDICDTYAMCDTRVRVIHRNNGGVSVARQHGLEEAVGEYVIHADPDDWVEPDMLQSLYSKAVADDADMVICDFYVNYGLRQEYSKQEPDSLEPQIVLRNLFQHLHGSCWNKLVRRGCYSKYNVAFDPELSFCEDLYCNASLLLCPIKVVYLAQAFYHYEQAVNINSLVNHYDRDSFKYDVMLRRKFCDLLCGEEAYVACEKRMSYSIIFRAYEGCFFSSEEFKTQCLPYYTSAMDVVPGILQKIKFYMACHGFYALSLKLFSTILCIRKLLRKCRCNL